MMEKRSQIAIFLLLWLILWLPLIQMKTQLFPVRDLRGQASPPEFPAFTLKGWFSNEFQEQFNPAAEHHIGFRNGLIRFRNQLEYTLFRKANAAGVVVGRGNYLYETDYIRSYTGRDYLGDYFWAQKFNRLERVADTLAALGVNLAVVLEPGKATFYPEYIPRRYLSFRSDRTNYGAILREAERRTIPLLDLNRFFADIKPQAPYPLFPKGGIHWSVGGMVTAADTLLDFIGHRFGFDLPRIVVDRVEMSDSLRDTDDDLARIMNLMFRPNHPEMGYPEYHLAGGDTSRLPRVLAISDSYYFNFLNARIPARAFANEAFWYYNQEIYPETWSTRTDTSSVDIRREVEGMDVVLIMVTERFYHRFDWDFTDVLYALYYPDAEKEYRYDHMRGILRFYSWFDELVKEADFTGKRVELLLKGHADYLFWQDDQAGKVPHDVDYYRMNITKDSTWMQQIREKARINGISVDEQVRVDARWLAESQNQ
ncbi:MAG: hypothetical protein R6V75_01270 [Bacteroidales bacterium]